MNDKPAFTPLGANKAPANPILPVVRELLFEPGQCYSEHALIKILVARGLLPEDFAACPKQLFQAHFALFNALYQLRDELGQEGLALDIGLLEVRVYRVAEAVGQAMGSGRESKLRAYYLDWQHFEQATDESVGQLLDDFWRTLGQRPVADSDRREALEVMALSEPVSYSELKQRYRRLAMESHPDRGGDTAKLQQINWAMSVLEQSVERR
ncbi:DNA-J related domain-containing protein [Gilvimarinus algae]|uniref:DNA-J related domain-containing protein n=1 Tax=Gilvimarinus algae TaxID=3058037 RepID=A0ABT8TJ48_9GAMM|nr:DNA-J related domain-containing protein [Gilvimarinus sp. SDUM040014]MDO3384121.1 DNA-J related domain-containing protein [Gilvimarinus sp. SDUM040014]